MTERNKLTTTILWVLAAAYAVALVANISFGLGIPIAVVLLISVAFALLLPGGTVAFATTGGKPVSREVEAYISKLVSTPRRAANKNITAGNSEAVSTSWRRKREETES